MQHWVHMIQQGSLTGATIGFLLILFVSFLPVFPIPVIAGVLGAVYPFWIALFISWSSASVAAVGKFYVLRYFLRNRALGYLKNYPKLTPMLRFIEENGFSAVLLARVIPVVPSAAINIAASVTPISTRAFVMATLLGKLPIMVAFTVAGNQWRKHIGLSVAIVVFYLLVIALLWWRLRKKLRGPSEPVTKN